MASMIHNDKIIGTEGTGILAAAMADLDQVTCKREFQRRYFPHLWADHCRTVVPQSCRCSPGAADWLRTAGGWHCHSCGITVDDCDRS